MYHGNKKMKKTKKKMKKKKQMFVYINPKRLKKPEPVKKPEPKIISVSGKGRPVGSYKTLKK